MARALRIEYPGAFYHVTCRGNDRKPVFRNEADRRRFLLILQDSLKTYGVILHAYVLMNNHVHLLVETPQGNLSRFMRQFSITFTSYFNRTYHRAGHLFQGRYKALLVDKESYLLAVSRYIHLNPVRSDFCKKEWHEKKAYLRAFPWSSLSGYLNPNKREKWIEYKTVLGMYAKNADEGIKQYWIDLCEEMKRKPEPLTKVAAAGLILGSEDFVGWVKKEFLQSGIESREIPTVSRLRSINVEEILGAVSQVTGVNFTDLVKKKGPGRYLVMEFLYQSGGLSGKEVGQIMGVDYSTVSQTRKRLKEKIKRDANTKRMAEEVERILSNVKI